MSAQPDMIISDFFMPKMSGREMIEKIRENSDFDSIKIIFLTVAEFQGDDFEQEMSDLKISAYIQKPLDTGKFIDTINSLLKD